MPIFQESTSNQNVYNTEHTFSQKWEHNHKLSKYIREFWNVMVQK